MPFIYELIPADMLDEVQKINQRLGQKRRSTDWVVDKDSDAFLLCHRTGRSGPDASWPGEYVFSYKGSAFCFKVLREANRGTNGEPGQLTFHIRGIDQQLMASDTWPATAGLIAEALNDMQQSTGGRCEVSVRFAEKEMQR